MDAPFAAFLSAEPVAELSSRDDACALSIDLKRAETHNADPRHAFPRVGNRRLAVTAFLLFMRKASSSLFVCSRPMSQFLDAVRCLLHSRRRAVTLPKGWCF